ncbi:MAG: hypothetical protein RMI34_05660 [Chloroherpetonaceae bacterium]|nr:hypothetical protein [Chloroherpetonaceae bacterium]MCS7210946.1 hypothetical protein [Chloroherpetonaceae bacterium]MDW8019545.1 hypothetical protein [Chloroherpetonaceae bacterium]MDW8465580.1 hypothetical protein [Chloroherpetonaceae bacterium]
MKTYLAQTSCLLLFVLAACQSSHELTDAERAKFDARLQALISGRTDIVESDYDVTVAKDGKKLYGIVVRGSSADEIRKLGIAVNSALGEIMTVRCTVEEMKKIAKLPSVKAIEAPPKAELYQNQ